MAQIGIFGSGNFGANTAFFLAEKNVADVLMYDVQDGLATGKALDMMEAAPVRGYRTKLSGTDSPDEIAESDVVIIAAGLVRKPGMAREDLFAENKDTIVDIAGRLADSSAVVIVATEPVDFLTTAFVNASGLPARRVMGVGGFLDSIRLRYLLAKELSVSMDNVTALVIGRHATPMLPLADYCTVSGIPITSLLDEAEIEQLFERTRQAGDLIVDMAERASAYYGPSAVACDLAESILRDSRRILSVSLMFEGQYGIEGVAMSLPAIIGEEGIVKILEPKLTADQKETLETSAESIRSVVAAAGL